MKQEYYSTDIGIVIKDENSIRIKSSYVKKELTIEEFEASNPVKIKKGKYLEELNAYFKNTKYEWQYNGNEFKKLDNFEINQHGSITNYNLYKDIPKHKGESYIGDMFIVLYHNRLYYTFLSGNYYPQMQLLDFKSKQLTGKWTNIKNLAPVFNKTTKTII